MKVTISDAAETDLREIGDYIGKHNPARAETFVNDLLDSAYGLGKNPKAYPLIPNFEDREVRRKVHGDYLILLRIDPQQVTVLHILHGARDYASLMFPED